MSPKFQAEWIRTFNPIEFEARPNKVFKPNESELSIRMNPRFIRSRYLNRMNPNEFVAHLKKVSNRMNPKFQSEWIRGSSEQGF